MNAKPDASKPEQSGAAEVEAERRSGRSRTRVRRLARLPAFCSARQAAWALLLSHFELKHLIVSGSLPARRVTRGFGQYRFEIAKADLDVLAETVQ